MKHLRGMSRLAALAAALALSQGAVAQEAGFYVGGSIGQVEAKNWCDDPGMAGVSITSCDDKDTAFKAFGGYRFNRHFAVEGSYINFGEFSGSVTIGGTSASATAEATGWGIAAVGILPVSSSVELFGKLGFLNGESDTTVTVGGTRVNVGDDGTEIHYGVGAVYNFSRNLGLRAEWEHVDDADLSMISIGVQYRF